MSEHFVYDVLAVAIIVLCIAAFLLDEPDPPRFILAVFACGVSILYLAFRVGMEWTA